jgi:signal transduction histidine kinase
MSAKKILIIEDKPENISILFDFLEQYDYELLVATDGESGLEVVKETIPDLILLDVMMPGINGFETCRRLKKQSELKDIPVIFMTALSELENKIAGFEAGGVDYVTKPFQQQEFLRRIHTHLKIYDLQRELVQKNHELEAFSHTVAHDLKNPLNIIVNCTELVEMAYEAGDASKLNKYLTKIRNTAYKAADIIESLLLLAGTSRYKQLFIQPLDMRFVIAKVQERLDFILKDSPGELKMPNQWPFISGYPPWIEEIWINYITNAFKYGGQPPVVELGMDEYEDFVRFWVRDNGPGLSQEEQAQLFVPFTRLHTHRADGHGLGLSIVQNIITKLGGQAGVESTLGQGSKFYFTLPRQPPSVTEEEEWV